MPLLTAQFWVEDVEAFLKLHRENDGLRRRYGCTSARALRSVEDPDMILVLLEFPTVEGAQAYLSSAVGQGSLERATVSGIPRFEMFEDLAPPAPAPPAP
jgi:hypothetical protein